MTLPSTGGAEAALALLDATWAPAERRLLGGWVLRRGLGGGNRVGSFWPRGPMPEAPDAAIAAAEAQSRAWDQPAIAQIGPDNDALDALLAARGWRAFDHTLVLDADAGALAAHRDRRMIVRVRAPLAALDELWREGGVGPERRAVMARTPGPSEVLMVREDDRPAAAGFVAAAAGGAMLHAVHVAGRFRRRGVARALTAAAGAWALENGAARLTLAVTVANAPARALYERMGFVDLCAYHYRLAP